MSALASTLAVSCSAFETRCALPMPRSGGGKNVVGAPDRGRAPLDRGLARGQPRLFAGEELQRGVHSRQVLLDRLEEASMRELEPRGRWPALCEPAVKGCELFRGGPSLLGASVRGEMGKRLPDVVR